HHDMFGYLGAIGCGMLFATVTGLLILAIIDTLLGVAGVAKGIADIKDGHIGYGITEILASIAGTAIGWKNFASARAAGKAAAAAESIGSDSECSSGKRSGTGSENGDGFGNAGKDEVYSYDDDSLLWAGWNDYEHVMIEGEEYTKIGNRYYTQHAVERIKPSGMRYSSTTDVVVHASRIYEAGRGKYGRSISPNYVEVVINYGSESLPIYVNGSERVNYTSGSVTVVTEDHGRIIVTIITN
ncbi:MAG: hypothetical protein MJ084_06925, partial [Saccharofermentans sp.]|nr:hypothetical protein [Saccharofermentans sp.]